MVGLGTIFIARDGAGGLAACGAARSTSRARLLWMLMLMLPLPYIATTAGWITAEVGRQPWLIYGIDAHARRMSRRTSPPATRCSR